MDLERLAAAGWYDPEAPDAADRRAMFELFDGLGLSTDEVLAAFEHDHIHSAGIDALLRRGELSARDVAAELGADVADVVDTYRLLGIRLDDLDAPTLSPGEVELVGLLSGDSPTFEPAEIQEINRAASAALSMLAESIVAVFVAGAEGRLASSEQVGWRERAEITQAAGELGVRFGHAVGLLFRHHLRQAVERQRSSMVAAESRMLRTMTVGFVDLVGFTSMSSSMTTAELVDFIRGFEARSYDVAHRGGGRIVKIIGDEVMVAALTVQQGCGIVLDLIEEFRTSDTAPRGGVAAGEVIGRLGDYFGPVVNLASRLVDLAVPGEVLAPATIAEQLGGAFRCEPAGRRQLKGFPEPVAAVSVLRG